MVEAMLTECPAESVQAACANADAKSSLGTLEKSWAGYVVGSVFGAKAEGQVVALTREARDLAASRTAEKKQAEADKTVRLGQRVNERAIAAHRRFGDAARWEDISVDELD